MLNMEQKECRRLWHGVMKLVKSRARQKGVSSEEILKILSGMCFQSGEFSHSREMLIRLATVLIDNTPTTIIAPCCPDYTHTDGRYDFRGVSGGISLLAQKHIRFLRSVSDIFTSQPQIVLLIADHEADDPELCKAIGRSRDEFQTQIAQSIDSTRSAVSGFGWKVFPMTSVIPTLIETETELTSWLLRTPDYAKRIVQETQVRAQMYYRLNPSFGREQMVERTAKTAAQYIAVGQFAAAKGWIVCNHTTTNLSWYKRATSAAILHNPISIY